MTQEKNGAPETSFVESGGYHPVLIRKKGSFCVYLPELKISGVGNSLEEAYAQFERNFKAIEIQTAEYGLSALTPEPYPTLRKADVLRELSLFFIKMASSVFIVIFLVVLLLPNITASFRHNLIELLRDPKYWALEFPAQVNARLDKLKPEEEEAMRTEWNRLLGRAVPIFSPLICPQPVNAKSVIRH